MVCSSDLSYHRSARCYKNSQGLDRILGRNRLVPSPYYIICLFSDNLLQIVYSEELASGLRCFTRDQSSY